MLINNNQQHTMNTRSIPLCVYERNEKEDTHVKMNDVEKPTLLHTVLALLGMLGVVKSKRTNVALDITPHGDGTFDRHYGTLKDAEPSTVLAFLKSVAKALATGKFPEGNYDTEYVAKQLKTCRVDKVPTSEKAVAEYLASVMGRAKNSNLHRYLKAMNNSMKYVKRGGMSKADAKAARQEHKPAGKTTGIEMLLQQLVELME